MDCTRCLKKLSASEYVTEKLNLHHFGINETLNKLSCMDCRVCIYLSVTNNDWVNIDAALRKHKRDDGWKTVTNDDDKIMFYILSQIMYNEIEGQTENDNEAYFDFPDESDLVKILWEKGNAVGFYTVKMKESLVFSTMEAYGMTTLDTAYIRKSHRRRGLGVSILEDLVKTFPDQDIGVSTPVSFSMYMVAKKFLKENPNYNTRLWEIKGVGSQGNRKLIFFVLKNLFRN